MKSISIPEFILNDNRISDGAKILYGKIAEYSKKTGYCKESNKTLDGTKSGSTASHNIKELVDAGYIKSEIENNYLRQLFIIQ